LGKIEIDNGLYGFGHVSSNASSALNWIEEFTLKVKKKMERNKN
jgi:hypothetical protein